MAGFVLSHDSLEAESLTALERTLVIAHYERFSQTIAATFGGIPITTVYLPEGFDGPEVRVSQLHKPVPPHIPTIAVTTRSGTHSYIALTANSLLWRAHAYGIAFESWSPIASNPAAARFGRIAIEPAGTAPLDMLRAATTAVLSTLSTLGLDAVIVLDGAGIVLWIPFDDAPDYDHLRAWLHTVVDATTRDNPMLFEVGRNEPPNRIRLSVRTNAPGLGTSLPYTLRCLRNLPVVSPILRSELPSIEPETLTIERASERFAALGDVFAAEVQRIGAQHFAGLHVPADARSVTSAGPVFEFVPRAEVIQIAYQILSDGKPRSADEIIVDAIAKGLWPKEKSRKYLYVMLKMYVEKTLARGREPLLVQDPDRRFRLNHAPDDNPDPKPASVWTVPTALIAQLRAAASGDDSEAFELAVCAAFAPLGFKTTHVGGTANPDGYADAELGPLGYRFMIECKTSGKAMQRPDIFEASKYREQFTAQYAILIAPAFGDDKVIAMNAVSMASVRGAWTTSPGFLNLERRPSSFGRCSNPGSLRMRGPSLSGAANMGLRNARPWSATHSLRPLGMHKSRRPTFTSRRSRRSSPKMPVCCLWMNICDRMARIRRARALRFVMHLPILRILALALPFGRTLRGLQSLSRAHERTACVQARPSSARLRFERAAFERALSGEASAAAAFLG